MLDGVYLTLLIGPLETPIPAPQPLTEALQSVQVTAGREGTGFQLTFTLSKLSPLQVMLAAGLLDPMITRVIVIATMRGIPNVICDGVVTHHAVAPGNEPGQSTLTLTGDDLSVLMDVEERHVPYPNMPELARINLILAQYAIYGIVPIVVSPAVSSFPRLTNRIPTQTTTDLAYIRGLAGECGYTFFIEPGPVPFTSIAYFGPDVRIPIPQPALSVNSDWTTNVESLSFSLDGLAKRAMVFTIFDPLTKRIPINIPMPDINILKPPLGLRLTPPAKKEFAKDLAGLEPDEATRRSLGYIFSSSQAVSANGSLNVTRYGHILRARLLVGVRGAGITYDGLYYVESVTHDIKRGDYKQSFSLSRDGLISQTPVVLP